MKYRLTSETRNVNGVILHRIEATEDIPSKGIKKGDKGGWLEKERLLNGMPVLLGDAWVFGDAMVFGDAIIRDNAEVFGNAKVCDNAIICGNARIYGNAMVCDNAYVVGYGRVFGDCVVKNNHRVYSDVDVYGSSYKYNDDFSPVDFNDGSNQKLYIVANTR